MSKVISRRQALVGLVAGLVVVPSVSFAARRQENPTAARVEVADMIAFDPVVRRNPDGTFARFNLAFRTEPRYTGRVFELLDEITAHSVAELDLIWTRGVEGQSLTMFNATVHLHECARLSQQARGQDYDEFGIVVESTHGSLRRPAASTANGVSDYRVTPSGVQWERRIAQALAAPGSR